MQITFDPLDKREADYVRNVLGGQITHNITMDISTQVGETLRKVLDEADRPDVGADAPSAAPLPPDAPLPAAADLFSTALVAQPGFDPSGWTAPPPPVPTAPAPAAAPPAAANPTLPVGAVDKDGLPHDPRIHSGTKVTNADGTWRKRRGVADETVAQVEAELRALMAIPVPAAPVSAVPLPPPIPAPPAPVTPTAATQDAPVGNDATTEGNVPPPPVPVPPTSAPATAPIPSPPVPPAPTAAADGAALTFAGLMRKISGLVTAKTITPDQVDAALQSVQLTKAQMNLLSARTDLIPAVDAYIDSLVMGAAS